MFLIGNELPLASSMIKSKNDELALVRNNGECACSEKENNTINIPRAKTPKNMTKTPLLQRGVSSWWLLDPIVGS